MASHRRAAERWPRGALGALVLLLAFELFVARTDWIWGFVQWSESGVIDVLESEVVDKADDPRVLVFGSSRVRDAIAPRELERALGLPERSVLNLAMSQGAPLDALGIYRRNREKLRKARVALVGVDAFQLSSHTRYSERAARFATLAQRLRNFGGDERKDLLIGWLWRSYDAKEPLRRFFKSWVKGRGEALTFLPDGRMEWRPEIWNRGEKLSNAHYVRNRLRPFRLSKARVRVLVELCDILEQDGLEVRLFQVPTRPGYWVEADRRYPRQVASYRGAVVDIGRDRGGVELAERAEDYGLTFRSFVDYGHLKPDEGLRYTRAFAEWLRRAHPDVVGVVGARYR